MLSLNRAMKGFFVMLGFAAMALGSGLPVQAQGFDAGSNTPAGVSSSGQYRVGPGDVLKIDVFRSPEFTTETSVGEEGYITFPALGTVQVAGLDTAQISRLIAERLRNEGILRNPSVNTILSEIRARRVMVMGTVDDPGEVILDRPNVTLSAVLAQAGARFDNGNAVVTVLPPPGRDRQRQQFTINDVISGQADRIVSADEVIVVEEAPSVYVSGEVKRAGAYPIEPGMTVGQAIALGGGITPRGSSSRIEMTRTLSDGSKRRVEDPDLVTIVEPGDLIVVKTRIF